MVISHVYCAGRASNRGSDYDQALKDLRQEETLGVRSEQKLLKLKHHKNVKQVLYRANYLIVKRLRYPGFR